MQNYKPKQGTITEAIYLQLKKTPMTGAQIREKFHDVSERAIRSAIARMKQKGAIGRDINGAWCADIEDSGLMPSPVFGNSNSAVIEMLEKHGPLTSKKICFLSGLDKCQTRNAIYNLKRKGIIGKNGDKWGLGFEHDGVGSRLKQALALLEEGKHTLDELAEILGIDKREMSRTLSRIKTEYGLSVKTIYTLG